MRTRRGDLNPALMLMQAQIIERIVDAAGALQRVLPAQLRLVTLEALVEDAANLARHALGAYAPPIETVHESPSCVLEVDAARLERALANLMVHAAHGRNPSAAPIVTATSTSAAGADIRVTQAGAGLDPRALAETKRHGDHANSPLDLEMALARQFVESQGGSMVLRAAGRGMQPSLLVRLPAHAVRQPAVARSRSGTAAPLAARLDGAHVLLIEDDPDALGFLALTLRQAGATVSAFRLAAPAFAFYARGERTPDIIVSDITMPAEDGYSLLWRVRSWEADNAWIPVPAVAVSAFSRSEDVQRARTHGFDAHLRKPVDVSQLITLIGAWTRGSF